MNARAIAKRHFDEAVREAALAGYDADSTALHAGLRRCEISRDPNGAVALVCGLIQALRLSQWQGHRTLRQPLIWVLHLGYAWLTAGLLLKGVWFLFAADFAAKWMHALTVGAFATMILAVMTRASLGHTGRALIAPAPMAITYLLVTLAAVVRILAPTLVPNDYDQIIAIAGALWIAAFGLFLWVYTPILLRARVDGRPG